MLCCEIQPAYGWLPVGEIKTKKTQCNRTAARGFGFAGLSVRSMGVALNGKSQTLVERAVVKRAFQTQYRPENWERVNSRAENCHQATAALADECVCKFGQTSRLCPSALTRLVSGSAACTSGEHPVVIQASWIAHTKYFSL